MNQVTYDIKETVEMLDFLATLGNAVDAAMLDGKIDFLDLAKFFQVVPLAKPALEGSKIIPKELGDLTDAERAFASSRLAMSLKLNSPVNEQTVEKGFDLALRFVEFVAEIRREKALNKSRLG